MLFNIVIFLLKECLRPISKELLFEKVGHFMFVWNNNVTDHRLVIVDKQCIACSLTFINQVLEGDRPVVKII